MKTARLRGKIPRQQIQICCLGIFSRSLTISPQNHPTHPPHPAYIHPYTPNTPHIPHYRPKKCINMHPVAAPYPANSPPEKSTPFSVLKFSAPTHHPTPRRKIFTKKTPKHLSFKEKYLTLHPESSKRKITALFIAA